MESTDNISISVQPLYLKDSFVFIIRFPDRDTDTVRLDDVPLVSGNAAPGLTEGEHTLTCGENDYPLIVCASENIPAIFIVTRSGSADYIHEDKKNKEPAAIRVYEDGKLSLDQNLTYIKTRGNATLKYDKKSYSVKFRKETDLLEMGKAKKWILLANHVDLSLVRNVWGWEFAKAFGLRYTSEYRFADLYMKSGLYITEVVKRLYASEGLQRVYPDDTDRICHILEHQVYGMAPTRIIYLIATNYILGFDELMKATNTHFVHVDAAEASKNGTLQRLVLEYFGE